MLRKIFRVLFTIIGGFLGYGLFFLFNILVLEAEWNHSLQLTQGQFFWAGISCMVVGALIFFLITPKIQKGGQKVAKEIESDLRKVPSTELIPGIFGLIVGLFLAYLISQLYRNFVLIPFLETILSVLTYVCLGYLGVIITTRRSTDFMTMRANFQKTPSKSKSKGSDATPKILDTSVIIDGRIADIMKTGFIEGPVVIPEFVLVELRHIADSSDGLKRNRGRRGLDVLNRIQSEYGIEIYNTAEEKTLDEIPEVDVKLLKLAQIMNGKVVTNDFNLNKVASIKGVEVLNINELANTLKPVVLPGEDMQVFLVKEGKENNQAVAYLDDGTMIVIEDGRRFIGETVNVSVTSVLQTAAGRMIFAKQKKKR